ncbi:7945_t:CDS:1, partial [Rhizophagus irregularis]
TKIAVNIATQLKFDEEETEAYHGMSSQQRRRFNVFQDNNSKIAYVQALADRKKLGEKN